MKTTAVLLSDVLVLGFGKPQRYDLRFDLTQKRIQKIAEANSLEPLSHERHYPSAGYYLSAGWVDMRAISGEPGYEARETLASLAQVARAGGFTHIGILPETNPPLTDQASVMWLSGQSEKNGVNFLPIAGLSPALSGENLSEILDLKASGAVAFTNGNRCLASLSLVQKALEYLQVCNGLTIQFPHHSDFVLGAQIHEGASSTRLGMKGIPAFAESLIVERDLKLLDYTGGRLHFSGISTAESVAAIAKAKAAGLQVSCDVAAYQNAFQDTDLADFDTNKKVLPPFRDDLHQEALTAGLLDGTIDVIASHHCPLDPESKELEFDLADFGMASMQTAFATAWTSWGAALGVQNFIKKITENPRQLLGLEMPRLEVGAKLDFTLFDPTQTQVLTKESSFSRSKNTPFFGQRLQGKVLEVFF